MMSSTRACLSGESLMLLLGSYNELVFRSRIAMAGFFTLLLTGV